MLSIRSFRCSDIPCIVRIQNAAVLRNEVLYFLWDEPYFISKFLNSRFWDPAFAIIAEDDREPVGFIIGIPDNAIRSVYLNSIYVLPECRRRGIGTRLINELLGISRVSGYTDLLINNNDPVNLDWHIPGAMDHDHNNAPGVDIDCMGYPFLHACGFTDHHHEVAMYLNLKDYVPWDELTSTQDRLKREGIFTGLYDPHLKYDFDGMCDRVHSEYWRQVLQAETQAHLTGQPCSETRFLPDGRIPRGPRKILTAVHNGHIVGFTGPVDKQLSGRGYFTGICTDPLYEKRGIASTLFNLLMQEFIREGAAFSTLFTGENNHAQKIYKRASFRAVRTFSAMARIT